jgi:preprotein translocase subunit SecD
MRQLIKKPIIVIWFILIFLALLMLASKGLQYGVDFRGGTVFQIILEEPVPSEDMSRITSIISRRLDWAGMMDTRVTASGNQYVVAQIAETNPEEIARLRSTLLRQGKFEAILDGNILFLGEDIKTIYKDPARGYGVSDYDRSGQGSQWTLPFILSSTAATNFSEMAFHRCSAIGYDAQVEYDCEKTYFFIDRPTDAIFVLDKELYDEERQVPTNPDMAGSPTVHIDEILRQTNSNFYVVDSQLTDEQITSLEEDFQEYQRVRVPLSLSQETIDVLEEIGYRVVYRERLENRPWVWEATGLKSVISLTEGVANMNAPSIESPSFQTFQSLTITGGGESRADAATRLEELVVLLESGSLPIAIDSISTESISPYLGEEFLKNSLWIGLIALLTVGLVLFVRYKLLSISIPIMLVGASEILILLGMFSLINFRLDLAAVAGVLATIGTGVDHKIIITDELIKSKKKDDDDVVVESLVHKVKKAFFIVFAAGATIMATMLPIIFFSVGLSKLIGFAITIIIGSVIGIIITRPVYAEIAKRIAIK